MPRAIVLFDIDGTLLRRAGPHHRAALIDAIEAVSGLPTTFDGIEPQGQLDRDIITEMMSNAGASREVVQQHMTRIVEQAQAYYLRTAPDLRRRLCPGVRLTLRRLSHAGIPLGLVTGNLSSIGWHKMQQAGLLRYFRFGAFAEQASTRAGLVEIALRRARRSGWLDAGTRASLIGDHPNDVRAAKLNGIRSIAVASGVTSRRELIAHKPDVLLPDLRCLNLEMVL